MGNDPTPVLFQNNTHPLASKLTVSWDAENIKASEIGIGTNKLPIFAKLFPMVFYSDHPYEIGHEITNEIKTCKTTYL